MTTIIGIQGEGFAFVCVDSRISNMDEGGFASQITTLSPDCGKVALNGRYLLGAAGDVRAINILHHAFVPPVPPPAMDDKKLNYFFTTKFIPSLRECFEKQGYAHPEKETSAHIAEQGSTVLAVISGRIYVVEGDYSWSSDANGVYALGTGSPYALGALQVLLGTKERTPKVCKDAALKALKIASGFDPYTGPPFQHFIQHSE